MKIYIKFVLAVDSNNSRIKISKYSTFKLERELRTPTIMGDPSKRNGNINSNLGQQSIDSNAIAALIKRKYAQGAEVKPKSISNLINGQKSTSFNTSSPRVGLTGRNTIEITTTQNSMTRFNQGQQTTFSKTNLTTSIGRNTRESTTNRNVMTSNYGKQSILPTASTSKDSREITKPFTSLGDSFRQTSPLTKSNVSGISPSYMKPKSMSTKSSQQNVQTKPDSRLGLGSPNIINPTNRTNSFNSSHTNKPGTVNEEKRPLEGAGNEEYDMSHKYRGSALIFNHTNFDVVGLQKREGTGKDCACVEKELTRLGFDVKVYDDLTKIELKDRLQEAAETDHSQSDCLVVFVMSHGLSGRIYAFDGDYPEETIWRGFTGNKCPTLRRKPKLFFVQACRGNNIDPGVSVGQDTVDALPFKATTEKIPIEADILLAYATVKEYYSWRNSKDGSWFIQELCEELRQNGQRRDLQTLLTFVNRRVSTKYQSKVDEPAYDRSVQMPTFTSTLTKLVMFREKRTLYLRQTSRPR